MVLNGVDEMIEEDRHAVYEAMKGLASPSETHVKLFVSCREHATLRICLKRVTNWNVQVSTQVIIIDMENYVRYLSKAN